MSRAAKIKCVSISALFLLVLVGCKPTSSRQLKSGIEALNRNDLSLAILSFDAVTKMTPTDSRGWNHLGVALHRADRLDEADTAYQRAISSSPVLPEAYLNRAALAAGRDNHRLARDLAIDHLKLVSNSIPGWIRLGLEQLALGHPKDAEISLLYTQRSAPNDPRSHNAVGVLRIAQARESEAVAAFNQALKADGAFVPARLNLAILEWRKGDIPAAVRNLDAYLFTSPAPYNLAEAEAFADSLRVKLSPPPAPAVPPTPSAVPPAAPKTQTAPAPAPKTPVKQVTTETKPSLPAPQPKKVVTARATPTPEPQPKPAPKASTPTPAAVAPSPAPIAPKISAPAGVKRFAYSKSPAPAPGNRSVAQQYFQSGSEAYRVHNFRLAMTEFETAVTADPRYFEAHANLGLAAQKAGNIERALSAYDSAMSINPTHADTRYNFALALYRGDYWFDAVQEAEKVVAVKPDHTSAHLLAAKIYSDNARNKTLARSHYLKVLEIDPRNSESASIKIWLSANPK